MIDLTNCCSTPLKQRFVDIVSEQRFVDIVSGAPTGLDRVVST